MPDATIIPRVRWRERQTLEARDLSAEQRYHLAQRRRHAIGHHGWGVVRGLALRVTKEGVVVEPGYGVDGYGRELVLPAEVPIAAAALLDARDRFAPTGSRLAVWLVYGRAAAGGTEGRHRRWREVCRLRLTAADADDPCPPGVPEDDLDPAPHRPPPDDPEAAWPLYLGRVRVAADDSFEVDMSGRPLATLRAAALRDPAGRVQVDVAGSRTAFRVAVKGPEGTKVERLSVAGSGTTLRGRTRAGAVRATGVQVGALAAPPAAAAPGRLYRVPRPDGRSGEEELRIELHGPTAEAPTVSLFAVRGPAGDGVVAAQPGVGLAVRGKVTVLGRCFEGPIAADHRDPRFVQAVTEGLLGALSATAERLVPIRVEIAAPQRSPAGRAIPYTVTVENPNPVDLESIRVTITAFPVRHADNRQETGFFFSKLDPYDVVASEQSVLPLHTAGHVVLLAEATAAGLQGTVVRHAARSLVEILDSTAPPDPAEGEIG